MLFSAPMVRAILDGRKTQTRRVVKPQPPADEFGGYEPMLCEIIHPAITDRHGNEQPGEPVFGVTTESGEWCLPCRYGGPGDRLWVRETWARRGEMKSAIYKADSERAIGAYGAVRWTPSIHMPRWASRITLEVTGVRVERLRDISESDCRAEGCGPIYNTLAVDHYRSVWESINGAESWTANPWVWVIEFKRIDTIDT
jgi:hypothetical protein